MTVPLSAISRKQVALLRACRLVGGRGRLARQIGASASQIGNWVNRGDTIPYHYAVLIAKATNHVITLDQLCPEMRHVNRLVTQEAIVTRVPLSYIRYYEEEWAQYDKFNLDEKPDQAVLTQPLLVDTDYHLLAFAARLHAHQQAKSTTVPVIVIDVAHHMQAQAPIDSVLRLCPVSEQIKVGEAIGQRLGNRRGRPLKNLEIRKNIFNFQGRSLDIIALLVSLGNRVTYNQAKQVVIQGCPALIQAMDNKQLAISLAAKLAKLPPEQQQALLAQDKKTIRKQIKGMSLPTDLSLVAVQAIPASKAVSFVSRQQSVDIIKIYHWLLQQGAPVSFEQQQGEYRLIWRAQE